MVYNSQFNESEGQKVLCGCGLFPMRTAYSGAAPQDPKLEFDIVDEGLALFKPNMLFRTFEFKGDGDRVLVYCIFFINQCLQKIEKCQNMKEAKDILGKIAAERPAIPGEGPFGLGGLYPSPKDKAEGDAIRAYFSQIRKETVDRLLPKVFLDGEAAPPSKWWISFGKRKFLNKSL